MVSTRLPRYGTAAAPPRLTLCPGSTPAMPTPSTTVALWLDAVMADINPTARYGTVAAPPRLTRIGGKATAPPPSTTAALWQVSLMVRHQHPRPRYGTAAAPPRSPRCQVAPTAGPPPSTTAALWLDAARRHPGWGHKSNTLGDDGLAIDLTSMLDLSGSGWLLLYALA